MDFRGFPVASIQDSVCFPSLITGYISHYETLGVDGFVVRYKARLSKREASSLSVYIFQGLSTDYIASLATARVRKAYAIGTGVQA